MSENTVPAVGSNDELGWERAGFLAHIEACRREVAQWPEWMRSTSTAPKWMEGWDD